MDKKFDIKIENIIKLSTQQKIKNAEPQSIPKNEMPISKNDWVNNLLEPAVPEQTFPIQQKIKIKERLIRH